MIKYSILYPYYDKFDQLLTTLSGMMEKYFIFRDKDFEIIVIEDSKNAADEKMHTDLMRLVDGYHLVHIIDEKVSYNSASKYNRGAEKAQGDVLLLSNPEVYHNENILKYLDENFSPDSYYVFDCMAVHKYEPPIVDYQYKKDTDIFRIPAGGYKLIMKQWYQHHKSFNRGYHFLSAISKEKFFEIGGFDERLCSGIAYEDDFWFYDVRHSGLNIVCVGSPFCMHIEHPREYGLTQEEIEKLKSINHELWKKKSRGERIDG